MEWNGFWHFHNVMQFMGNFIAVSESGLQNTVYLALPIPEPESALPVVNEESAGDGWEAVLQKIAEFADDHEAAFIRTLLEKNLPVPDVIADELIDGETVIDMVELGWSTKKIAFVLSACEEAKANITKAGWTVFDEQAEHIEDWFGGDEHE